VSLISELARLHEQWHRGGTAPKPTEPVAPTVVETVTEVAVVKEVRPVYRVVSSVPQVAYYEVRVEREAQTSAPAPPPPPPAPPGVTITTKQTRPIRVAANVPTSGTGAIAVNDRVEVTKINKTVNTAYVASIVQKPAAV